MTVQKTTQNIFAINAPGLILHGYSPLPRIIKDGHGRPAVKSWSDLCEVQPGKSQLEDWASIPGADLSLACGFRGLVAIDVDDDRPEILAAVRKALPQCSVARRGSKGFVLLARHADGPQQTINVYRAEGARKDPLVEIMGIGRSIAIPPSIHAKTGMPYQWIDPGTGKPHPAEWLLSAHAELPVITVTDIERLIAALAPWSRKPRPPRAKANGPAPVLTDAATKRYHAYAQKGLADATAELAALTEGRPTELFRAVCSLGWAVAHGVLGEIEFEDAFIEACEQNGLADREGLRAIEASIASGLRRSANDPLPLLSDRPREKEPERSESTRSEGARGDAQKQSANSGAKGAGAAGTSSEKHVSDEWSDPAPLTQVGVNAAYPLDALPEGIRAAVVEVRDYVQAPLEMVAMSSLAALSVAAQGLVDVRRDAMLAGPVSLFQMVIGESGERKSTIDKFFTRVLVDFERRKAEEMAEAIKAAKAKHSAWEAKKKGTEEAIKQAAKRSKDTASLENDLETLAKREPSVPNFPALVRQDDTVEALAFSLAKEWPSAGIVSSEGGLIFGGHAMGKENVLRGLAQKNIFWDGSPLRIGRRTSESFTVSGVRLTIYLQAQEAALRAFTDQSGELARGIGFWARCFLAWPKSTQGWRPYKEPLTHSPHLDAFSETIGKLLDKPLPIEDDGSLAPHTLDFGPDAKLLWVELYNGIEKELRPGGDCETIKDVASKAAENIARLAALFHAFEHGPQGEIDRDTITRAGKIVIWHLTEARRFFDGLSQPKELADAIALDAWLIGKGGAASRDITHFGPNALRGGRWEAALKRLEDAGRVRRISTRPRGFKVEINPALCGGRHVA